MYGTLNILTEPARDTSSVDQSDSQDDAGGRYVQICLDGRNLFNGYREYMAKCVCNFPAVQNKFLNSSYDFFVLVMYDVSKAGKF